VIKRIAIKHFKSIDSLELKLGPLTVVVGPNGSGKSNFVDALRFVRDAAEGGLDSAISERHGIDSVRQWSPTRPYHVSFEIGLVATSGTGLLSFTLASARGQHRVYGESATWAERPKGSEESQLPIFYARGEDVFLSPEGEAIASEAQEDELALNEAPRFREFRRLLRQIETYSIFPNTLRTPQKPTNTTRLSSSGDNLTSVFKALTRSKSKRLVRRREEIVGALRKVMPNLDGIIIESPGGFMVPTFRVKEPNGKGHNFNVSQISDGTLRLFGLLTALYQPDRPDVIAMEEPEQTVNPGVLAVLADAIREVSQSGTQIVITTHSPHLVDLFEPEEILTAELIDGRTVIRPINEAQKQAVKDRLFSLGELMTAEGLHG
jgi:predicted ATPase